MPGPLLLSVAGLLWGQLRPGSKERWEKVKGRAPELRVWGGAGCC